MCPHVCQCGNLQSTTTTSQPQSQKLHLSADHNDATDEWIWSMRQAFTATCTTGQSNKNGFVHASTSIGTSYPSSSALQLENLDQAPSPYKSLENNASPLSAWLPQNETLDGLWGSSAFVDIDGSPIGMAIDLDMQASDAGLFLYGNDSPLTPMVERQDSLPTPGLDHSPSSVRAHDPSFSYAASAGMAMSAHAGSSSFFSPDSPALSAQGLSGAEPSRPRQRSLTVGSLSGMPSSLADSVRMLGVSRPQTPGAQQGSVPSSPRLGSTKKFSSVPCRRSRPSTPALSAMFAQDSVEIASLKERRMASHASRAKVSGSQRSPLAGLFAAQDLLLVGNEIGAGGSEPSPTVSELSLGLSTPTSLTFSPPCTPLGASFAGLKVAADADSEEVNADGTVVKAKIALHHHRTKLQRNVLNEIVTSLQGAYKHCRRQCSDPSSLYDQTPATELNQLQLEEQDPLGLYSWMTTDNEPTWSTSGVVVAGETKEMRKNRQKAESKMRMRRKEIAQFAALTTYA
ncbi:uncharacterized protein UBRO2_03604 [Ustilago bromivora]|uniref:Uncharacterized protein n=1 Tax=Ustilago bromivora TaxID=307758 RepID=A0A8H8QQ98_9BASI|nr:uncharacterized protein UBRO2_03604 [Ustilago bromivora]